MILTLPYKVRSTKYQGKKISIYYNFIMPWAKGFTIGSDIYINGRPDSHGPDLIHHEFQHVLQWEEEGFLFPFKYIWSGFKALAKGKRMYYDNEYEVKAYKAQYEFCKKNKIKYRDRYLDD